MQLTPNFDIAYADTGDNVSIEDITAAMADSVDDAFVAQTALRAGYDYRWANAAARTAQAGMVIDSRGYQIDTNITYRYNGSAWKAWESDWISYTPTLTNVAIGTGGSPANVATYRYEQGRVRVRGNIVLGTSGMSVAGTVNITLPLTAAAQLITAWGSLTGSATMFDTSATTNFIAFPAFNAASVTAFTILNSGTNGLRVATSPTSPFTWAASDSFGYDFVYDPA